MSVPSTIRGLWAFDNRWQLLVERVLCRRTTVQIYRLGPLQMLVDNRAADAGSIRSCISGEMYARFLSMIAIDNVRTVLDVGANVGGFSLLLMSRGLTLHKLMCIELNPSTFERLRFNILSNLTNVGSGAQCAVINAAVCNEDAPIIVRVGRGSTGDSIEGDTRPDGSTREVAVQGATLDGVTRPMFGEETIDLCKMDIEGAESDVILGSKSGMLRRVRVLLIEIHHAKTVSALIQRLESYGLHRLAGENDATMLGVSLFVNDSLPKAPAGHQGASAPGVSA